jgi:hypothetical protein
LISQKNKQQNPKSHEASQPPLPGRAWPRGYLPSGEV